MTRRRLTASLTALAVLALITSLSQPMPAMAAPTTSKTTATPLKLSPSSDTASIDTSKLATKAELSRLSSAIIQVYGKVAELERQVRSPQGAGGGNEAVLAQQIVVLTQQVNALQGQIQSLQASQAQLQNAVNAIHDRIHRLDGANP